MDGTFDLDGFGRSYAVCRWCSRARCFYSEKEIAATFAKDRDRLSNSKVFFL